jgi:hypothetical protein
LLFPCLPPSTSCAAEEMRYIKVRRSGLGWAEVWALKRDTQTWDKTCAYRPNRFFTSGIDANKSLMPFMLHPQI